mmetsp:Transcript_8095/g.11765  ORF Transcript_8095/g.11765 Transcript_8095/m.11765 type:complete len:450 (-) Transcript_8095:428-1777(-)|eukprot:CAMPEP_0194213008 /NCGR_PEP_ID=MMETSP0156-20130528/13292_1 /TAXON_ID=33649 /ORGANISM="Thalassionema nitzschioides, Strain L26-B" /LENGTH=449 /DNA_ID=CAMNT_0038940949 /DNA_START=55 /DNA_END=1404 /DNA_ORIENTATION=+
MESPTSGRYARTEYCQTSIMDQNLQSHRRQQQTTDTSMPIARNSSFQQMRSESMDFNRTLGEEQVSLMESRKNRSYASINELVRQSKRGKQSIRFQVVIWYIGQIDMVQGRVPVTFRVTIFWNDQSEALDFDDSESGSLSSKSSHYWKMHGRQSAVFQEMKDEQADSVQVPPVSILNAVTFDTIGSPEVLLLREDTRLMRWTCMYKAILVQENWRLDNFPHDHHDITLKLGILAHRMLGDHWDRKNWELGLATDADSRGSTRVPHGLCVDNLRIPEFMFDNAKGLRFSFCPLKHGPGGRTNSDLCLEVKLRIYRESHYYDYNIMPLLGLLNLVAISTLFLEPQNFFQRALLILNIAFVEIGIRMTTDQRLPHASYQIKLQKILNEYFVGLLCLVLEGNLVYVLHQNGFTTHVRYCDLVAAVLMLTHNSYTIIGYYYDAHLLRWSLAGGS